MPIPLKLQVFEGPMDLLMHLIEKNKIDIYDIPIVTITDQYLEYVRQMDHDDMNVTSEFLVMAATLLDIKSRMLLPRDEEEEGEEGDPRDELVRRLLEYKMYKYMSEELREKERHAGYSFFRPQDLPEEVRSYVPPLNYEELIGDRTVQSLRNVFTEVLKRKKSRVDPVRSGFGKIQKEEISVADKELYVRAYLALHPHADFREMLELENSREEIIVTFLVILELMKHQKILITQEEPFGKILIDLVEDPGKAASAEEPEDSEAASAELPEEPEAASAEQPEDPEAASAEEPEEPEAAFEEPEAQEDEEAETAAAQATQPLSDVPAVFEQEAYVLHMPLADEETYMAREPHTAPEAPHLEEAPYAQEASYTQEAPNAEEEPYMQEEPHAEKALSAAPEKPAGRRLIRRMKRGMNGISRHAFLIAAKKMSANQYRRVRGVRLWNRKKYRNRYFRNK